MEMFDRIFDAAQIIVRGNVPCNTDYKQVAQTLVKYQFGRDAGIRTAQNDGKWMLAALQFSTAGRAFVRMLLLMTNVAFVAFRKPRKCLICGHAGSRVLSPRARAGCYQEQPAVETTPDYAKHPTGVAC